MSNGQLYNLIGKIVRINRGGPESSEGLLLKVKNDYIVVLIKHEGIVYYNLAHVKSITIINRPVKHFSKSNHHHHQNDYCKSTTFLDALRKKKNRLIKINRGGPDSITGVLIHVYRDYIKLVENEETVIIFTQHIKSFTPSIRFNHHGKGPKKDKR